ncbi:MAG: TetR/AcrR family transcriptional regulator C-terminal domain-containing protein [Actinomycetota bacterium]|nr:TetR/AcrR family transcriptional regulator C-terminal domain-containing protein [Actinomycetota bacterium]MDH5313394.1 TetR/AcrR family transcriptional regulator C-terminal domain-containing protein [Actinomycetota bacterium]
MPAHTKKREAETPRERLTRDRVVEAALRIMDEEGLDAVTMRRVAREVGVEAMSLYHHVRDKEDLLDAICARVMQEFRFPEEDRPWIEVARDGAREWRRVLRDHPNVMAVWADRQRPMTDLEALMPMEFALRVIGRAGIDERASVQVFNVIGGYIMGVVMMEVGAMFSAGTTRDQRVDLHGKLGGADILAMLPADRLPRLVASLPYLAECDPDEQFEYGLELLLAGIQAKAATAD